MTEPLKLPAARKWRVLQQLQARGGRGMSPLSRTSLTLPVIQLAIAVGAFLAVLGTVLDSVSLPIVGAGMVGCGGVILELCKVTA